MTEREEASVQENVEPTAPAPQETPPAASQPADEVATPGEGTTAVVAEVVTTAAADEPAGDGTAAGLTEDLRELREAIAPPTADTTPDADEAQPTEVLEPVDASESAEASQSAEIQESAAGSESTADTGSLDDIAPGTVAAEPAPQPAFEPSPVPVAAPQPITSVSWWPFVGYIMVWLGVAGYAVWRLQQLPAGRAAYETELYSMSVLVGLSLLAAGPFLLLIVWFASWIGRKGVRVGSMFISALAKGAVATLIGAIIWIGAIMLIDYLRLGHPY